jgi:endonuclease-8
MPEGDTIYRAAAALRTALVGKVTTGFDAPRLTGPRPGKGRVIERVESHGKHLEMAWDDGIVLHTHMRMTGSWHLYRPGERWRKSTYAARVIIEVPDWIAVCFNAPVVETFRELDRHRHPGVGRLGPDLCQPDADLGEVVRRMETYADRGATVGDLLLDQRVAAGVGNVYKSEVLFACGLSPFATVAELEADDRVALAHEAARQLRANLEGPGRITAPVPGGLAVYGRNGQLCHRCGGRIESERMGVHARTTYYCPTCQHRGDHRTPAALDDELAWSSSSRKLRMADPHPAANKFLRELPNRSEPVLSPGGREAQDVDEVAFVDEVDVVAIVDDELLPDPSPAEGLGDPLLEAAYATDPDPAEDDPFEA